MSDPSHPYLVGLIGTGVLPSLTPPLHMAEARAQGIDYVYRPIDLTALSLDPARLGDILTWARRLGFDAVNVTHPCKRLVLAHLDRIDPLAASLGAVNTVLFTDDGLVGYNTDTTGFEAAFRTELPGAARDLVVQIGAGGAGSAVADALLRAGTRELVIVDLDADRARELGDDLSRRHGGAVWSATPSSLVSLLTRADGVVQCTPIGMHDHPGVAFDTALLRPEMWVADIVYRPLQTELLIAARAAGCRTLSGGAMAVFQAVDAFELITGVRPDADRMTRQFHDLVIADDMLAR